MCANICETRASRDAQQQTPQLTDTVENLDGFISNPTGSGFLREHVTFKIHDIQIFAYNSVRSKWSVRCSST